MSSNVILTNHNCIAEVLIIRRMTILDLERVAVLSGQLGYEATPSQVEARFRKISTYSDIVLFCAVEPTNNTVVGWAHVEGTRSLTSNPFAEIMAIVVDESVRRSGIGRAIINAAEKWAVTNCFSHLRLRSGLQRAEDAHKFYLSLGYVQSRTSILFRKDF